MSNSTPPPRVLFLGMQGNFSHPPLRAVLEAGIEVPAVVVPAAQSVVQHDLPAIRRREQPGAFHSLLPVVESSLHTSILQLSWERHIPLWEVQRLSDPETIATLAGYQPDIICVACFSKRIPRAILDIARLGWLNVHPSLLPANRGPEPLFWTFREGSRHTGVSIHLMDEGMDTGPVVAQEAVEVADGISYSQLETQCAMLGGTLLARSVWGLYNGLALPVAQDETKSSYHGFPTDEDFVVPVAEWSARHVYNFICGVASWGTPVTLHVGKQRIFVKDVLSYSHGNTSNSDVVDSQSREEAWVRCKQGTVRVRKFFL